MHAQPRGDARDSRVVAVGGLLSRASPLVILSIVSMVSMAAWAAARRAAASRA